MSDRCPECGSYDRECANERPVSDCGCARCLKAESERLRAKIEAALTIPSRERRKNGVFQTDHAEVVALMIRALRGGDDTEIHEETCMVLRGYACDCAGGDDDE